MRGRVHSSTVTVAVFDEHQARNPYQQRAEGDFELSWWSGTGCGGQHRNKHQNSARITHLPTGIARSAQTRSRINSQQTAMADLLAELDRLAEQATGASVNATRRAHVGSGERSDKRRTLRFQEGRAIDHITGKAAPVEQVMKGRFDLLW